jgi:hypothetical protein
LGARQVLYRRGGCLFRLDQAGVDTPGALGSGVLDSFGHGSSARELVSKDAMIETVWRIAPK